MLVQSSNLAEHNYDPATNILTIRFNSGHVWNYFDFPAAGTEDQPGYDDFCRAESAGSFFHRYIKGKYRGEDVTPKSEDDTLAP